MGSAAVLTDEKLTLAGEVLFFHGSGNYISAGTALQCAPVEDWEAVSGLAAP
jgi:hypothetical protein